MQPATVLLIDDLEDVRDVLAEVLSHEGYHVLTASSLPEAEAVRERVGLAAVSVVITNVRLTRHPDAREGIDLIRCWHAAEPRLAFILMSGDLRPDHLADLPSEVVRCLPKPFAMEALLSAIGAAIGR